MWRIAKNSKFWIFSEVSIIWDWTENHYVFIIHGQSLVISKNRIFKNSTFKVPFFFLLYLLAFSFPQFSWQPSRLKKILTLFIIWDIKRSQIKPLSSSSWHSYWFWKPKLKCRSHWKFELFQKSKPQNI